MLHAQTPVGEHLIRVYQAHHTQSLTARACTLRTVEREVVGRRILIGYTAGGTHQAFTIMTYFSCIGIQNLQQPITLLQCRGNSLSQSGFILLLNEQAVYDHFYVMIPVAVHLHVGHYLTHHPIHSHVEVSLASHALEEFTVMSLTVMNQRSQDVNLPSTEISEYQTHYLLLSISGHTFARHI